MSSVYVKGVGPEKPTKQGIYFRLWPVVKFNRGPLKQWGICIARNATVVKDLEEPDA